MELILYAFAIATGLILMSFLTLLIMFFKRRWKKAILVVLIGVVGGIAGYLLSMDKIGHIAVKGHAVDFFVELKCGEVYSIIGVAIGLLLGLFAFTVRSKKNLHI